MNNDEQTNLRLPKGMKDQLRAKAQANSRSLNAEVVHRLRESVFADAVLKERKEVPPA